ncbi:MAG: hypothetical protein AB1847_18190 [bacterium]
MKNFGLSEIGTGMSEIKTGAGKIAKEKKATALPLHKGTDSW